MTIAAPTDVPAAPAREPAPLGCVQAYRFALDPTPRQQRALASSAGGARFCFNWGLEHVKQLLDRRAAGEPVEVPWSLYALRRAWNQAKDEVAPWWPENSKEAYNSGLDGLARALKNFSDGRSGKRKGPRVGFPRFRKRGRTKAAVRFTTGTIRVEADRKHVTLPRLGALRTHESTRKLARRLEAGSARILSATVSRTGGRWFVSFTCQVTRTVPARAARPPRVVAADAGVTQLLTLSTGERIPNPAALRHALVRLRRLNRQLARRKGPRTPAGGYREPSANWLDAKAELARAHARVANLRRDALHQATSRLAREYDLVVVEALRVANLLRRARGKRGLNRALADAALAELRRLLGYKCPWAGSVLLEADPFFPSSKSCSGCGVVKATLPLTERVFRCDACGLVVDRDVNAALNLAALASSRLVTVIGDAGQRAGAGSGPGPSTARGGQVRPRVRAGHRSAKREAGTGLSLQAG
ncbi:MAG TPA: IS607 family element RNA-guided endonuclease TnpB [Actinomycetes bacterium]|nr:IS607 family element RNA-guided endonuclease TnpB [Actinomycetes bacterium]